LRREKLSTAPEFLVHQNRRIHRIHVRTPFNKTLPPQPLDVLFEHNTERPIVPRACKPAVDFGTCEDKPAAFRERDNLFNRSRINTVVVCALTSNLKRAQAPGNVLLDEGEANLSKPSVVNISQIFTVDKIQLDEYIGAVSKRRMQQILEGVRLLTEPREVA